MEILTFPNPLLFQTCEEVTVFGEELKVLLEGMFETMQAYRGIGLAANQVGLLHRMFTMEGVDGEKLFLVNPRILRKSQALANIKEGCLSAPGDFIIVPSRLSWVEVEFQDETGEKRVRVFKDLWAVCVQHELEHLNGIAYMENISISKPLRKSLAKKWNISK